MSSYASATTTTSGTGSGSTISLSNNIWYSNTLSSGGVHYYSFNASSGYSSIYWEDFDYNNSYGDIQVAAINSSGSYLLDFTDAGSGGQPIYVSSSGTITLIVTGLNSSSSGSYRIKYSN
jgi:hypothetical protein